MKEVDRINGYLALISSLNLSIDDIDSDFIEYLAAHPKFKKFWEPIHLTATEVQTRHETCREIIIEVRKEYDARKI